MLTDSTRELDVMDMRKLSKRSNVKIKRSYFRLFSESEEVPYFFDSSCHGHLERKNATKRDQRLNIYSLIKMSHIIPFNKDWEDGDRMYHLRAVILKYFNDI